jgi:hypothetical protein
VTGGEMIARLEALLERVRIRAAAPRGSPAVDGMPSSLTIPVGPTPDIGASDGTSPASRERGRNDESTGDRPHDSRERLVVAEANFSEGLGERRDAEAAQAPAAPLEEGATSPPSAVPFDESVTEETLEEAPASSRRSRIAEPQERLAEMAFGAEEPLAPLHTPPPESGRIPTAVEGTLKGAANLFPESTRADLVSSHDVIEVIGQAQRFAPTKFVALLDASLAL